MKYHVFLFSFISSCVGISIDGHVQNTTRPWSPVLADLPLGAGASHQLTISQVTADVQLLLVQAHVQRGAVTLTQEAADGSGPESVSGPHVGLVARLLPGQTNATVTIQNTGDDEVVVLAAVSPLPNYAPVPGGCSQTEDVPIAPFFRVHTAQDVYSFFDVPRAQLGINRSVGFTCNAARGAMEYQAYVMYPAHGLRSNYANFRAAIAAMLEPTAMQSNAFPVTGRDTALPLRYTFAVYRGYTVVYGVAVAGAVPGRPAAAAAYVPAVLHGCPVLDADPDLYCPPEIAPYFYVTAVLFLLCGLLLLTTASKQLALQVLLTTAVLLAALTALVFRAVVWDEPNAALIVGILLGISGGALYARQLTTERWSRGSMTVSATLLFGLSVGAVFFFIPALQLEDLTADAVFWPAYVFVTLALAFIVTLPGVEWCIVVTRCSLGAIWVMISGAMLANSVTLYVFGNLFRRATYTEFRFAILQMDFLIQDYVCVSLFGLALLVSLCVSCAVAWLPPAPVLPPPAAAPQLGRRARHWSERRRLLPADRQRLTSSYGATAPQAPPSA